MGGVHLAELACWKGILQGRSDVHRPSHRTGSGRDAFGSRTWFILRLPPAVGNQSWRVYLPRSRGTLTGASGRDGCDARACYVAKVIHPHARFELCVLYRQCSMRTVSYAWTLFKNSWV